MNDSTERPDTWAANVLKNAELPTVLTAHVDALRQALNHSKRTPRWVLPSGFIAAVGTAALVATLTLGRPTPSIAAPTLGQVDQAASSVKSFTVTHRIGDGGAEFYVVTEIRDGDRWKSSYGPSKGEPYGQIIMDGNRTVTISRFQKRRSILIDDPSKLPKKLWALPTPENFLQTPSELFRARPGKIKITRGVQWNGRTVDEFENIVKLQSAHSKQPVFTVRHALYADPETHLPLLVETGFPGAKTTISESFSYDYSPIPASIFEPAISKGTKVVDLREERAAIKKALTKNGLVVVDDIVNAGIFLPDRPEILRAAKARNIRVTINGGPPSYTWPQLVSISRTGHADKNSPWRQMVIYAQPPVVHPETLRLRKFVTVRVNGKPFTMPVMRIANAEKELQFPGWQM